MVKQSGCFSTHAHPTHTGSILGSSRSCGYGVTSLGTYRFLASADVPRAPFSAASSKPKALIIVVNELVPVTSYGAFPGPSQWIKYAEASGVTVY